MSLQFKSLIILLLAAIIIPAFLILVNPYTSYDLKLHYGVNADRDSPDKIVVVALNEENIPHPQSIKSIHNWPRETHAKLIEKLDQVGVKSIVFDVFFNKKTPEDDRLAQTIANSNKTFLVNKVEQNWIQDKSGVLARYQRIVQPLQSLAINSVLTAPSVYSADSQGSYYKYAPVLNLLDRQLPQLPLLLVCWELIEEGVMDKFVSTLNRQGIQSITLTVNHQPAELLSQFLKLTKNQKNKLKAIIKLTPSLNFAQSNKLIGFVQAVSHADKQILNFLGKSTQFTTLDYAEVLAGSHQDMLNGATIFVGLSSIFKQTQVDSFLTPASFDGVGQHGIFLLATAYENIAYNNSIQSLSGWSLYFLLVLVMTLILSVFLIRHYRLQGVFGIVCSSGYLIIGLLVLNKMKIWLPLLIPIIVMLAIWMIAMYHNIKKTHIAKQRVSEILSRYLPQPAITKLLATHANKIIENQWGVCLVTDVRGFTALSEQHSPEQTHKYLNKYYRSLINVINQHQGIVSDLIGDSMMALWLDKKPNAHLNNQAVLAAFEIVKQVKKYNLENPEFPLYTGIGIHVGDISLGSLGSETHFEYRPIGDMINTASRIESLNKIFHLPILASGEFVLDISSDDVMPRFIANIVLSGKQVSNKLYSLEKDNQALLQVFSKAIICLEALDFKQANYLFKQCVDKYSDEASRLYLWLLKSKYIDQKFDGLVSASWLDRYNKNRQH